MPLAPASVASLKISPPGLMRTLENASFPPGMGRAFTDPPLLMAPEKTLKPESLNKSETSTNSSPKRVSGRSQP